MCWVGAVAPVVLWVLPHTARPPCAPTFPSLPRPASPCCGCCPCCCCCCPAADWGHPALHCGAKWPHGSGGRVGGCRGHSWPSPQCAWHGGPLTGWIGLGWVGLKLLPLWCCGCSLSLRDPLAPRHSPPCPGLLLLVVAVLLVDVGCPAAEWVPVCLASPAVLPGCPPSCLPGYMLFCLAVCLPA